MTAIEPRGEPRKGDPKPPSSRRLSRRSCGFLRWLGLALLRHGRLLGEVVGEALHGMDAGVFDGALRDLGDRRVGHA